MVMVMVVMVVVAMVMVTIEARLFRVGESTLCARAVSSF